MVPDFTEVSLFKEDICQQLETYSSVIDSLKVEMQELTESSHHISQVSNSTVLVSNYFI